MADIDVSTAEHDGGYAFQVTVREGRTQTHHEVALKATDYDRLAGGRASPEVLVRESFRFLLEREPKESILRSFDLTLIGHYFPEYERVIRKRL